MEIGHACGKRERLGRIEINKEKEDRSILRIGTTLLQKGNLPTSESENSALPSWASFPTRGSAPRTPHPVTTTHSPHRATQGHRAQEAMGKGQMPKRRRWKDTQAQSKAGNALAPLQKLGYSA